MLLLLILLAAIFLLIWIGSILQRFFADFLSHFLLAYLTRFGFSDVSWVGTASQIVSTVVVLWLAYALWKDFGRNRLQTLLKALNH